MRPLTVEAGRRAWMRAPGHVLAGLAILLMAGLAEPAHAETARVWLSVALNSAPRGDALLWLDDGDVWIEAATFDAYGLRAGIGRRAHRGDRVHVSLRSLEPDLRFALDERALTLTMTAAPRLFAPTASAVATNRPTGIEYRHSTSAHLNYAVTARRAGLDQAAAEAGLSVGGAFIGSTASYTPEHWLVRGLTYMTIDDRAHLRRTTFGDTLTSSGVLGGSAIVAGVSLAREFAIDPYFVRQPGVDVSGTVTTPSTVDVYVDGRLVTTRTVGPGEFRLTDVPVRTGANSTRLVIHDAFGGTREISDSVYQPAGTLARGLSEYAVSAGFERGDLGTSSWAYGRPLALGRYRRGLSDRLTLGGRFEAGAGMASGGPHVTFATALGEFDAAGGWSRRGEATGHALAASFARTTRRLNLGAAVRVFSSSYATVSLRPEDDRQRLDRSLFLGVPVGSRTSLTLQHRTTLSEASARAARLTVLTSTRVSRRGDLTTSVTRTTTPTGSSVEVFAAMSVRMGQTVTGGVSVSRQATGTSTALDLGRPLPVGRGVGYQLHTTTGGRGVSMAMAQVQGAHGRAEIRQDLTTGATSASLAGSLVAIGGHVHASQPVQEGFALVRVPGVAGVRATSSHQVVGRTNRHGEVLVPGLLPYYGNVLGIAEEDVPLTNTLSRVRTVVAPPFRGGTIVTFPSARLQGLAGSVAIAMGAETRVPTYGQLVVGEDARWVSPIGERGEFYLDQVLPGRYPAVVEDRAGSCAFTIEVPVSRTPIVNVGVLTCTVLR